MKIIKYTALAILLLIAMLLCSAAVMKILDVFFNFGGENIFKTSFQVGFISWLVLLCAAAFIKIRKK